MDNPLDAITMGWHPIGDRNFRQMQAGQPLKGMIVPLPKPKHLFRLEPDLRELL